MALAAYCSLLQYLMHARNVELCTAALGKSLYSSRIQHIIKLARIHVTVYCKACTECPLVVNLLHTCNLLLSLIILTSKPILTRGQHTTYSFTDRSLRDIRTGRLKQMVHTTNVVARQLMLLDKVPG